MLESGRILCLALVCSLLAGCGYMKMAGSKLRAAFSPTPVHVKKGAPENCVLVSGRLTGTAENGLPLLVAAVAAETPGREMADYTLLSRPGSFFLYLPEGRYQILVFADLNRNRVFEPGELVGVSGEPQPLEVTKGRARRGIIGGIEVAVAAGHPATYPHRLRQETDRFRPPLEAERLPAVITTLDDEAFTPEEGSLGLYQPAAFFERGHRFLYLLEEFDPRKMPVVFVHGAGGTPADWRFMVEGLDRSRFQPWFFYYPSGIPLETVTEIFHDLVLAGATARAPRLVIAAHSMGGVMVRAAINRAGDGGRDDQVRLFVSFCAPFGGVGAAARAAHLSPVVVPSWRDIATASPFLAGLYRSPLPAGLAFNLFFAYGSEHLVTVGPAGDGAIPLKSQLAPPAQAEAGRLFGFDETHDSILTSRAAREAFLQLLGSDR